MFSVHFSLKKPKISKKPIIAAAIILVVIVTALAAVRSRSKPSQMLISADGTEYSPVINDGGCSGFFAQIGLDAEPEPVRKAEVTVPYEFDEFYCRYNELQKHAGMDLDPYKGKRASQLTFTLKPDGDGYAVILVADGRIIGGHRTNGEYGGEMLPLI